MGDEGGGRVKDFFFIFVGGGRGGGLGEVGGEGAE